jgi:ankyrin repeat protein
MSSNLRTSMNGSINSSTNTSVTGLTDLQLGDQVLRYLGLDANGEVLNAKIVPKTLAADLSLAYIYIARGAQFRHPDIWKAVFNRPTLHNDREFEPFAFTMLCNGGNSIVPNTILKSIDAMLRHDAFDVNLRRSDGNTMLAMATFSIREDIVEMLLSHGADPTLFIPIANTLGQIQRIDEIVAIGRSPKIGMLFAAVKARKAMLAVIHQAIPKIRENISLK